MALYLVTGGAGFIGSHLVERLLREGHRVRVLDNFSTGRKENLAYGPGVDLSSLEVVEGDLRDQEAVERAVAGVEAIFHLGAIPSVARSVEDPVATSMVNIMGTLHLLLAARGRGVGRVVFASSASVYGGNADGRTLSEGDVGPALSPYGLSKLTGEKYMGLFSRLYGLKTISLRFFNVFGPRQNPEGEYAAVIPRFITFSLAGKPLPIFGDGHQTRDFTYVDNVVRAALHAVEVPIEGGEVFNVAAGRAVSLVELVATLGKVLGRGLEAVHLPPRPGEIKHSTANIELSRARLGYRPAVPFAEGLEYTVKAYRGTEEKGA